MDIKYNVSKYKDSKIKELKDSVSIEEPLEMTLRFKKDGKWERQNISITMRTPGNDEDLIRGLLFNEGIIENLSQIEKIEQKGDLFLTFKQYRFIVRCWGRLCVLKFVPML